MRMEHLLPAGGGEVVRQAAERGILTRPWYLIIVIVIFIILDVGIIVNVAFIVTIVIDGIVKIFILIMSRKVTCGCGLHSQSCFIIAIMVIVMIIIVIMISVINFIIITNIEGDGCQCD